ncbi:14 kDa phosphohistidine phosphatase isoform X4 [Numida meleagris]|uniref:14 kDa phosphohistidine phosphatase isoform X4 n=1 Tax=Numida meleagris TaxID=8996 RepID=UPI000B3D84B5|nr:14 kDa phosphohistidine phosphatase isoform X4 [Numida meleagris]
MGTLCSPGRRPRRGHRGCARSRWVSGCSASRIPRISTCRTAAPHTLPTPGAQRSTLGRIPRPAPIPWPGPTEHCWTTAGAGYCLQGCAGLCGAGWEPGCVRSLCCGVCVLSVALCEPRARRGLRGGSGPVAGAGRGGEGTERGQSPAPCRALPGAGPPPPSGTVLRPPAAGGSSGTRRGARGTGRDTARGTGAAPSPSKATHRQLRTPLHRPWAGRGRKGAGTSRRPLGRGLALIGRAAPYAPEGAGPPVGAGGMAAAAALRRVADVEIDDDGVFNRYLRQGGGRAGAAGLRLRVPGRRPHLPPEAGEEDPRLRVLGGLWASKSLCDYAEAESQVSGL